MTVRADALALDRSAMLEDVKDYGQKLTDSERDFLTKILRFFTPGRHRRLGRLRQTTTSRASVSPRSE